MERRNKQATQEFLGRWNEAEKADRAERKKLAEDIQRTILEEHYFVPVFRHAFVNAFGPRIAAKKWQDIFPTITSGYAYPWEDIALTAAAK